MAAPAASGVISTLRPTSRRAALKKERRKRRRQALAKLRDSALPDEGRGQQTSESEEDRTAEEERQRLNQEWMERERVAQEEFRLKREREETARRKKEDEENRIKEEWEARQKTEQEQKEKEQQERRDREEAVQKMLDQAESQLENGGPWKNPEAPQDYGTEKDRANCPFFLKTGACRFGDRCSRKHVHPACSTTLMIRGMFVTFGMEQSRRDDYDTDAGLEYSEEEVHLQFLEFFEDVLPEFRSAGRVVQFKVSCNFEPHLRGNVYVQYETEEHCREAFVMFNGRWYAGKQLQCEFCPVTRWKTAICGLFDRQKCPKGKHCNFLHVYRNPGNEFWEADRDRHMSPDRGGSLSGRHSERYSERRDRSWSQRSYSPDRSLRRRVERRSSQQSWRSRHGVRAERSRSRERRRSRGRSRSSSWSRDGYRDEEKREGRKGSPTDLKGRSSKRSRSPRGERMSSNKESFKNRRTGSGSPKDGDRPSESSPAPPHQKHSKKSKKKKTKKSKKKKKKRTRSSSRSSSARSDLGSGDEDVDRPLGSQVSHHAEGGENCIPQDLGPHLPQENVAPLDLNPHQPEENVAPLGLQPEENVAPLDLNPHQPEENVAPLGLHPEENVVSLDLSPHQPEENVAPL